MTLKNLQSFDPLTCISGKVMRLNRATANIFRKYLQPYDITDSQLSILFILTKVDGQTQKQLSDIAVLEKSSLNRNLKRLIEQKYLSRTNFPLIKLTEKGRRLINDIIPEWEKAMREIRELLGNDGEKALNLVSAKFFNINIS